jgi:hypothetical protein
VPRQAELGSLEILMILHWFTAACLLTAALSAAPVDDDAATELAKAAAAFHANQERAQHWNWNVHETRRLLDNAGKILQTFPSVTSESIIRSTNQRCNAIVAWGDGKVPYMVDADPDARCQAMDAIRAPFQVETLLGSSKVTLQSRSATAITLAIVPDKSRLKNSDFAVRCAASIQATVKLDPATFFPLYFDGEVMETGCDLRSDPVTHYAAVRAAPANSTFRKSARFRMEYALQKDKFQNPANSFWICAHQEFDQPWNRSAEYLYYWGRQLMVRNPGEGHRLIKETQTTAREFGAETQLRFDK